MTTEPQNLLPTHRNRKSHWGSAFLPVNAAHRVPIFPDMQRALSEGDVSRVLRYRGPELDDIALHRGSGQPTLGPQLDQVEGRVQQVLILMRVVSHRPALLWGLHVHQLDGGGAKDQITPPTCRHVQDCVRQVHGVCLRQVSNVEEFDLQPQKKVCIIIIIRYYPNG